MRSTRCILSGELNCQDFKAIHRVRRELGEPTEGSLLKRGGKNFTPYDFVGCIKGHMCLEDVEMFVQICGAVIELNSQSLPLGWELCVYDLIRERMPSQIFIIVRQGSVTRTLMSLFSRLVFSFTPIKSLL